MDQSGQQGVRKEQLMVAQALVGAIVMRDTAILLGKRASCARVLPWCVGRVRRACRAA